ncbi:MAG TPA: sigma 54-interacting transcriptional regulator [Blastocatellia bacterium]|nr:sigma 54-interacting transcriptional regulator [Blastocatellia bacterium]
MNDEAVVGNLAMDSLQVRPALPLMRSPQTLALTNYECFIGPSAHVSELRQFISAHAMHQQSVLLIGERGLRQEQVARALHQASKQWEAPFISVNVHGLHVEALHELLFGPRGLIETCQRGVIYINELAGLPPLLQQRFAVYLEEQRWQGRPQSTGQPRLIFATGFNPSALCAENRIAYGLIELLRPWSFTLKPLRERSEDIPYLATHLVERIVRRAHKGDHEITPAAMQMLAEYSWEGNIDELEAVLESAISRTRPREVDPELLPARIRRATLQAIPTEGIDLPHLVDEFERELIETALRQTGGHQVKAAKLLGLRVQTLNMKLKRLGAQKKQSSG